MIEGNNCCICCGDVIPEGMMVCPLCEAGATPKIKATAPAPVSAEDERTKTAAKPLRHPRWWFGQKRVQHA